MCASNSSGVVSSSVPLAGQPGRVDQAVHPAERRDHRRRAGPRLRHVAHVGLHEQRLGPGRGELGGQRFARLTAPAGDRDGRALPGRCPGDARAQPRRAAADQDYPVPQQAVWPARL